MWKSNKTLLMGIAMNILVLVKLEQLDDRFLSRNEMKEELLIISSPF
jgi:hypothetical protein